jgi:predicted RNA binding protein YcfA (HicA-like mRNA interferase family)
MNLPLLSGRQVLAALTCLGFVEIHRKGSYVKIKHADGRIIVFPFHDEIDRFTLEPQALMGGEHLTTACT